MLFRLIHALKLKKSWIKFPRLRKTQSRRLYQPNPTIFPSRSVYISFKGTMSREFMLLFFSWITLNWKKFIIFWLILLVCHRCQRHRWCTLSCEYLCEFSKKIRNGPNGIFWGWGKLIYEKSLKSKISWHCPFKDDVTVFSFSVFPLWRK